MTYFARFVSADAINKHGKLPKNTRLPEYEALISELQKVEKRLIQGYQTISLVLMKSICQTMKRL